MIYPNKAQTTAAVAAHYDALDAYYRDIWGEHVHHGYWETGRETVEQAVEALITLCTGYLQLSPGLEIVDIGCGYGATARYLADRFAVHVTGVTVSAAQLAQAVSGVGAAGELTFLQADWLANGFADARFDRAYAIESSENMPDKQKFFDEAFRTLKPSGRLVICAWLAADRPKPWEIRHLLEPICREGRLPSMGTEADYHAFARAAGFNVLTTRDISAQVSRTWLLCAGRFGRKLFSDVRYVRMLLDSSKPDRIFALTLFRLITAYRSRAMRYCVLVYEKP